MLDELFGETGGAIAQFVLALLVVLILILLVAWLLKKLGGGRFGATNSGQAELEIIDTLAIDPKRRLVLVRHGKLEHLLLIGGGSDEVVERSIVGGLPITARMQASKQPAPAPEKPAEPLARPSSKFLDRLERTNAARKSGTSKSEADKTPASSEEKTPDSDSAVSGTTAALAGTAAAGSAYAAMIASTSQAERQTASQIGNKDAAESSVSTPDDKSGSKSSPATAASTPNVPTSKTLAPPPIVAPMAAPKLAEPKSTAPLPEPAPIDLPPLLDLPKSSTTPSAQADKPAAPAEKPLPQSEREALEQSLDAALHDSLLAPDHDETSAQPEASAAPTSNANDSASDDISFNLFDDGELEREMEAALAETSPSPEASPELDAQSTAAIEAELAINLEEPAANPQSPADTAPDLPSAPTRDVDETEKADIKPVDEPTIDKDVASEDNSSAEVDEKEQPEESSVPKDSLPPLKDIPVELSRPDPVAVQIPSRGPAANATSVTKADNGITSESTATLAEGPTSSVDLSQLLETPGSDAETSPTGGETKPASGKSSDLDEEMRRLLGEIAGDPKAN